jgi:hypothetical protein
MKEKKRFDGSRVEKKRRQKDELQSKGQERQWFLFVYDNVA